MHDIVLTYSAPLARLLGTRRISRSLPESWAEVTPEIAWRCMDLIVHGAPRRQLIDILLDLPQYLAERIGRGEMYELLQLIRWMDIDQTSRAPIAPYIDITLDDGQVQRLYLPGPDFKNVTGLEYALLDDLFQKFIKDQDPEIEARMLSVVLRPEGYSPDPDSDPRVQLLSSDQTRTWLPAVRLLPESIRAYMTTLIAANRTYLWETYKDWLFPDPPSAGADDDGTEAASSGGLNFGWWGVFLDIAEEQVFGDHDHVLQTPIHTICIHATRKVDAANRARQDHEHARIRATMR